MRKTMQQRKLVNKTDFWLMRELRSRRKATRELRAHISTGGDWVNVALTAELDARKAAKHNPLPKLRYEIYSATRKARMAFRNPKSLAYAITVTAPAPDPQNPHRLPCPHARPDWRMCPWCLGLNEPQKEPQ